MSDSVRPHRRQPTRLPHPWDSPGKSTGVGCHFLLQCMKVKRESEVAQSCPTLSDPRDCSLPGSSIHGIFQTRVLEWGAIAFSDIYTHIHTYVCIHIHTHLSGLSWWLRGKESAAMQEIQQMQVQSLGQEDPLEEEMTTHSRILSWRIPWTEDPGRLQPKGPTELYTTEAI